MHTKKCYMFIRKQTNVSTLQFNQHFGYKKKKKIYIAQKKITKGVA